MIILYSSSTTRSYMPFQISGDFDFENTNNYHISSHYFFIQLYFLSYNQLSSPASLNTLSDIFYVSFSIPIPSLFLDGSRILHGIFSQVYAPEEFMEDIISKIIYYGSVMASDQRSIDCTVLSMLVEVQLLNLPDEREEIEQAIRESVENYVYNPTPATKSSIENLQKMGADDDIGREDQCMICLEDLIKTEKMELISLPCSHVYHKDCIIQWLKTSHFCPLCRFSMPQ